MDIDAKKNRWRQFYDIGSDTKTLVLIDYPHPNRPLPYAENFEARLQWAYESYQKQLSDAEFLRDDRVPALSPYTGTELFAGAFGCAVHYSGDDMPFALPLIQNASEIRLLREPDIFSGRLGDVFELARRLQQKNGNGAIFQLPDIQSPFDIAALIWEKSDFFAAMAVDPPAVKELVRMTENTLTRFLSEWFKEFGTEFIAHYPDYYMDGGVTVSEDEIGVFGPSMFREFCLPVLNRLSERFGGIGIHCCANAEHQWDNLKKISGLRLLNFVQPPDTTFRAYRVFADTAAMMHIWCGEEQPSAGWVNNYPADAHVVLNCFASDRDDAVRKCEILREVSELRRNERINH